MKDFPTLVVEIAKVLVRFAVRKGEGPTPRLLSLLKSVMFDIEVLKSFSKELSNCN